MVVWWTKNVKTKLQEGLNEGSNDELLMQNRGFLAKMLCHQWGREKAGMTSRK